MKLNSKQKILLFIPSLSAGGAERVMLFIAKNLDEHKFVVTLVVIGFKKETLFDTAGVDVIYLNRKKVKSSLFKIFKLFRLHKPDIVMGSLTHVNYNIALVCYLFPKITCIARETFVVSVGKKFNNWDQKTFHRINTLVSNIAHKRIDYFICQSDDMKKDMIGIEKYQNRNIVTINNPVADDIQVKDSIPDGDEIQFITVGRLVKQKGYQRIIESLSRLEVPFCYTIIGDGPEKEKLLSLAKENKVLGKINHIPRTNNVYEYLAKSHFYLQGSYLEGFPNALIESLAVGTPALVYEAPGGMNEIVLHGENGFMVKNDEDFVKKLVHTVDYRNSFQPKQVAQHVRSKYGAQKIIHQYEDLFENVSR